MHTCGTFFVALVHSSFVLGGRPTPTEGDGLRMQSKLRLQHAPVAYVKLWLRARWTVIEGGKLAPGAEHLQHSWPVTDFRQPGSRAGRNASPIGGAGTGRRSDARAASAFVVDLQFRQLSSPSGRGNYVRRVPSAESPGLWHCCLGCV
uniref:Putative secreted protein n=1 Tax=Ixodes ricinus TaxID=34613 RepID=A0A6B0UV61_IXORI